MIHDCNATTAQVAASIVNSGAVQPKLYNGFSLCHDKERNIDVEKRKQRQNGTRDRTRPNTRNDASNSR
ncbi:hypothetical protein [Staphylococcus hominis]|uniref:hypothetical protein n=1 Tax=Staphylococcus hominis TaxID=1290 RepID=UPI0012DAC152|nr:hypothetical protein [Staphylococcus hominis]